MGISLFLIVSNATFVNAETIESSSKDSNVINIEEALETSELNKFEDDVPTRALESLKENAVSATKTEYYLRSITDANGNTINDPKKYTEEEYNLINKIETRDFNNNTFYENSWIKLKMESYKLVSGDYDFYMFYDWKTKPLLTFHDIIGFSYPSTLSCNTKSAMSYHRQTIVNPSTLVSTTSSKTHTADESDYYKSSLNGVSFKFDLPAAPDTWPAYYQGYLNVKGGFTSNVITSSTIELLYAHQQISFPYTIEDAVNFLTTGNIAIKITGFQDEFRAADRFKRY